MGVEFDPIPTISICENRNLEKLETSYWLLRKAIVTLMLLCACTIHGGPKDNFW